MASNLDLEFERAESFSTLFKIHNYFSWLKRTDKVLAVPFYITTKLESLNFDCEHLVKGSKQADVQTFYCAQEEHKAYHAATGAKLRTCINCPNVQLTSLSKLKFKETL